MPTVRWSDVAWMENAGDVEFKDMRIAVRSEHIVDWQNDPDGRFAVAVSDAADGGKRGELVKFYPSL